MKSPKKPKCEKLTAKQEKFCYEYCIDYNATQAAIRAGYSQDTASVIGFENLRKPNIKNRISEMQNNLAETAGISALRILKEHERIAFSNAGQLRDGWISLKDFEQLPDSVKACIQEISTKTIKRYIGDGPVEEEYVKVKLYDKQKSLDSISRMLGFDAPVKQEITGKDGKDLIPKIDIEIIDKREDVEHEDTNY
ncbi:Terminase small subunit [Odoribacter splanchnicus]|jgi:phage terminase small subunit|uniref:terminase small subunit n=1 Tax=Odoribacter splanchnicus TaxID=28118 RepID=UPI000D813A6C|nr:terminase small subunit [Odoribacter splanchnicus]SPY23629.1 Terminase small subunit [Odoribacter splanchnicus]